MAKDAVRDIFDADEVREVLSETFYREPAEPKRRARAKALKPDHYEVICISLYNEAKVQRLKDQGHRKMSRSALIRYALDTVDLDALPKSY